MHLYNFNLNSYQLTKDSDKPIIEVSEISDITQNKLTLQISLKNGKTYNIKYTRLDYLENNLENLLK